MKNRKDLAPGNVWRLKRISKGASPVFAHITKLTTFTVSYTNSLSINDTGKEKGKKSYDRFLSEYEHEAYPQDTKEDN